MGCRHGMYAYKGEGSSVSVGRLDRGISVLDVKDVKEGSRLSPSSPGRDVHGIHAHSRGVASLHALSHGLRRRQKGHLRPKRFIISQRALLARVSLCKYLLRQ